VDEGLLRRAREGGPAQSARVVERHVSPETVKWGVAAAVSFCAIGMAFVRIRMSVGASRSWAFSGLPTVVGIALISTARLIGLEQRNLQLVSGAAVVLCAISLVLLLGRWWRAA
jgi:phosphatidylserine synthase